MTMGCCSSRRRRLGVAIVLTLLAMIAFYSSHGIGTETTPRRSLQESPQQQRRASDFPVTPNLPPGDPVSENLRIVTFGASRTYGSGLGPKLEARFQAYPYLLSSKVNNQAIRATGPDFPALCVQSMIGDEVYDVIVLEFFLAAERGLLRLAQRLRQRFPNAIIFFLRIWGPASSIHNTKERTTFKEWLKRHGITDLWDTNLGNVLMQQSSSNDWRFEVKVKPIQEQNRAIQAVGGLLYELPPPDTPDIRPVLIEKAQLYSQDHVHLSTQGHALVAREIQAILRKVNAQRNDQVAPWVAKDVCEDWFMTGESTLPTSPKIRMNHFVPGKFALELQGPVGWINIYNPLPVPAEVHLRYMVTGPPPSQYPRVLFKILGHGMDDSQKGTVIYPITRNFKYKVNVNRMDPIGHAPPGNATIKLAVVEDGAKHEWPFRITGIAITPVARTFS